MVEISSNYDGETMLDEFYPIVKENFARLAAQVETNERTIANTRTSIEESSDAGALLIRLYDAETDISSLQATMSAVAPKESPHLTGTPTAPTAEQGTNNTQLATTAFVMSALANAVLNSIVFGTYDGDGEAEQYIDLGFTPRAVEVYNSDGVPYSGAGNGTLYGGLALPNNPSQAIEITEGGFLAKYVERNGDRLFANGNGQTYKYKAYR